VVLSLRHLRLAELSRKDRCLVVSLSFLLIGTMSLRWMMPESFAEDFWAQAGSTTFAVEIGLALTAALFAGRGKVREAVRPIAAWDPAEAFELGEAEGRALYVPPGFAHGFWVLSDVADVVYHTTAPYRPGDEGALRWDDPCARALWPVGRPPRLSPKDAEAPYLRDLKPDDLPHEEPSP
jgi:hypothetical protein